MYYVRSNNKLWSELSRLAVCRGVDSMESTQIEKIFSFLYKKELLVLKWIKNVFCPRSNM